MTEARKRWRPSAADIVAGITVALVLLPQSLAYAEIAGVPPAVGLSAAALPPLVAAFFASSPYLQTGPVALTSLLTVGALQTMEPTGTVEYVALAALLALVVGAVRVLLGLARAGFVAYTMTEATVLGFTSAAAILIIASQVPTMFGLDRDGRRVITATVDTLTQPDTWSWTAVGLALLTIAFVLSSRKLHDLFPGVLLVVIAAVVWSSITGYDGPTIGELPGGFVSIDFDLPWDRLTSLLIPGFIIALVGYAEPASISRTFATIDRTHWSSSRELVSQGAANIASGLAGGFPVGGSFSRSSLNRLAGAKSAVAGGVTGLVILLFQPLSPLLEPLPKAVLGAVVFTAVFKLVKLGAMAELLRVNTRQGLVAWGTFAATLISAPRVERGIIIGIGMAAIVFTYSQVRDEGVRRPQEIIRRVVDRLAAADRDPESVPPAEASARDERV